MDTASGMEAVREVAQIVKAAGGRALLVGGCVRDSILGGDPKDFDVECFGIAPVDLKTALAKKFDLDLVGASFGVIKLAHLDVDVAIPRRETKLGLGHRAFEMEYDPTLTVRDASARRDFTVNAIYSDPLTGEIVDPWNGRADLERRTLRHVSDHFCEDPLRVLRGMQFVARFDLDPAPETIEVCRAMTPEGLASERLLGEWSKLILKGVKISKGLEFLRAVGWTKYYPELERLIGCKQDPQWHPEGDVWNHPLARSRRTRRRADVVVPESPHERGTASQGDSSACAASHATFRDVEGQVVGWRDKTPRRESRPHRPALACRRGRRCGTAAFPVGTGTA